MLSSLLGSDAYLNKDSKYMRNEQAFIIKRSSSSRCNALRKTSLVPAPSPLSRLWDFHSIDSAQKDSVPSFQEVAETFVCAPIKRPERQRPLPLARQRPQTFLFGQSGIRQAVSARNEILAEPASRMLSNKRLRRRSKAHSSQEH